MDRRSSVSISNTFIRIWRSAVRCLVLIAPVFALVASASSEEISTASYKLAEIRSDEVDLAVRLALVGEYLYQTDEKKLNGYEYCSNSVDLANRGELRRSIREATKALFLGQRDGNHDVLAYANRDLAYAYSLAGFLDRAAEYAKKAIDHTYKSRRHYRNRKILAPAYKILGDIRLRKGDFKAALRSYEQSLSIRRGQFVQISMANAYLAAGDPGKAKRILSKIWDAGNLRSLVGRGLGNVALAENRYSDALEIFKRAATSNLGVDGAYHKIWALEGIARTHRIMGNLEKAVSSYLEAVAATERVRSRFRSEEFKSGFFGEIQQIFDDTIALLAETNQVERALEISERSRARALLDLVRGRVQFSAGADAIAEPSGKPVSTVDLRAMVPANLAIVEFHVLPDRTLVWTIRRSGVSLKTIDIGRDELSIHVARVRTEIKQRSAQAVELGAIMYDWLIQPLALSEGEALVIIPHGSLHYLPFQALRGPNGYLVEERAISYAPSASALIHLLNAPDGGGGKVVVFGNPDLKSPKLDLPGAQREVERIKELYPRTELYVRGQATKERLIRLSSESGILHIAAHANVDEVDPLYSTIHLASTQDVPGELEAHEIYRLNLANTSLVVLSACNTGLGRVSKGDEIWGFARTFLGAGAQTLLVSLWPVDDESTELLMTQFYKNAPGIGVQQALRRAQIDLLRDKRFSHPFFWAAFNLVGDIDPELPPT